MLHHVELYVSDLERSCAFWTPWYLRWDLKPTHGYLQVVQENQALSEIEPLRLSGYITLAPK